jgi:hypothetical protein
MTAKQRTNQARFKKAIAEAKKLRKKNPSLTQAQAVKQAWAILYSKEKKVSGYSEERKKIHKNATTWLKREKKRFPDKDVKSILTKAYEQAPFGPVQKIGSVKKKTAKKKPTERDILNKIHKVKKNVDKLDEAQHEHMSIGAIKSKGIKTLQKKFGLLAAKKLLKKKKTEARKLSREMTKVRQQLKKLISL